MRDITTSRRHFIKTLGLGIAALPVLKSRYLFAEDEEAKTTQCNARRPNIIIIFTDDQGYADLGCYGSKNNKTPRMDQLAKEGTRFTNFYAQPVCGPSRSALLTGRYPIRSKGWNMPANEITFAELIREVGYQTACIGKWDVSSREAIIDRMPNAQGFDCYFGTLGANDGGGIGFYENNEPSGKTRDMGSLTRLYTDKAIDYLKNKRDKEKPFLLYIAHTMMHTIIDASQKFKGTSKGSLYGDVVEEFDFETGRLLDTVDKLGLRDNTLVIYTTDNGPWNQPAYYKEKKAIPRVQSSGDIPAPCAMARVPAMRADLGFPASFGGREKSRRIGYPTPSLAPSTSCPLSPSWQVSEFLMIVSSTESTRAIYCSARARKERAILSSTRGMAYARESGSISRPHT